MAKDRYSSVMGKSQIKSQVQITNHFYQNSHFLKMFNLYNLIYQKSHHI